MIRIGVTTYYEKTDRLYAASIPFDYINAVIDKNALPILIPVTADQRILDGYIALVDGILLTGGVDIDPALYGDENTGLSHEVCRERDMTEMYIIEKSLKAGIPILGICRGFQILNVFFGGTLYQDLGTQYGGRISHANRMKEREELHHEIQINQGSYLESIFGIERVRVNSRHHQGIKRAGQGLIITATADDGLVEAFENEKADVVAVQWHPENITGVCPGCSLLFQDLVDRAASGGKSM